MSDHQRGANERRTPAENMAIIKIYGGVQFPNTTIESTPLDYLKCPPDGAAHGNSSSAFNSMEAKAKRESLCNFNEPPVKARPVFRKYGINDFKFLKGDAKRLEIIASLLYQNG